MGLLYLYRAPYQFTNNTMLVLVYPNNYLSNVLTDGRGSPYLHIVYAEAGLVFIEMDQYLNIM